MVFLSVLIAFFLPLSAPGKPLLAQSVVATGQPSQGAALNAERKIALNLKGVSIAEAIAEVSKQSGVAIAVGEDVASAKGNVALSIADVTVRDAMQIILRGTGLQLRSSSTGQWMVSRAREVIRRKSQGVITGKVTDAKSGKGIAGASISIAVDSRSAVTDDNGIYRLAGIPSGSHTVTVRLVGYAKQTRSITFENGATITVDFKLEPSASVLDQVVVTGTVIASELKSVPSAMTVVTAKEIEKRGITRLDQLFRGDIPGLFVMNQGSDNPIDSAVMFSRGVTKLLTQANVLNSVPATNAIKVYVDGVELAEPAFLNQIDPRSIERIEILTGPQASTVYGSNAINGVMQIFTKRGIANRPQISTSLASGMVQNNFSQALTPVHNYDGRVSGTEGRVSYQSGVAWDYIGPWTPAKQTQRLSGYGGMRLNVTPWTLDMSMRRGWTRNRSRGSSSQDNTNRRDDGEFPPSANNGLVSPTDITLNGRTIGVTFGYTPSSWWSHELVVGTDASATESYGIRPRFVSLNDTGVVIRQGNVNKVSERYSTTLQESIAESIRLILIGGIDHWSGRTSSLLNSNAQSLQRFTASMNRGRSASNTGGFFQGQIGFWDALFITYGLRAEWNPNFGAKAQPNLAPRYGLAYSRELGAVTTKVRASYGRATRPPSDAQRLSELSTNNFNISLYGPHELRFENPELAPESQQGGEGGIELYFGNRGSLIITRYNQTVDNLIATPRVDSIQSLVPMPVGALMGVTYNSLDGTGFGFLYQTQNLNIGSIRNQGWELQGTVNLGPFTTRGTYSWTKSRVIGITPRYRAVLTDASYQPGYTFSQFPEHTWATNVSYTRAGTSMSLNTNGTGFLYRSSDALSSVLSSRLSVYRPIMAIPSTYRPLGRGYVMTDFNASQRLSSLLETTIQVQNLTNFYQNDVSSSFATIGRQTRLGLRYRWQ